MAAGEREFDIVVYGATGFTGRLVAEYLARRAPTGTRGALAGRNLGKLEEVRRGLTQLNFATADLPLIRADAGDPASLTEMARRARVVISTVGPYIEYGEPLVAACAAVGTDYLDLTGEPEFVDRMYVAHHETALASGARLVHSCGFDSIPHDLGALFTVRRLPPDGPIAVDGYVRAGGTFSGGTFHSAVGIFGRLRSGRSAAQERRRLERPPGDGVRRVRAAARPPHRVPGAKGWAVPFPTIDPQVVLRSAGALSGYGSAFTYGHYLVLPNPAYIAGGAVGFGAVVALAQLPPTRNLLLKLRSPGDGPSPEQRAKGWFTVRMVGTGGGRRVVCEVSGGDPGYGETAKMIGEAALCLAHDDLPQTAGQVTPAVAMGEHLITRLQAAGIHFDVLEQTETETEAAP